MKHILTLIVPCCNEAKRLPYNEIGDFIVNNPHIRFCFVNDGSTDRTLRILNDLQKRYPLAVSVISLSKNNGKAEAVRQGILYCAASKPPPYLGYWDADMATPLSECHDFLRILERNSKIHAIIGSRMPRLGATISRKRFRNIVGRVIANLISIYLGFDLYDSQCGAKIFRTGLAEKLFFEPFCSCWLFDVELFKRLTISFSQNYPQKHILEFPLYEWHDVEGSKLKFYHAGHIFWELSKIAFTYRIRRRHFLLPPMENKECLLTEGLSS